MPAERTDERAARPKAKMVSERGGSLIRGSHALRGALEVLPLQEASGRFAEHNLEPLREPEARDTGEPRQLVDPRNRVPMAAVVEIPENESLEIFVGEAGH